MELNWRPIKPASQTSSEPPDPPALSKAFFDYDHVADLGVEIEGVGFERQRKRKLEWSRGQPSTEQEPEDAPADTSLVEAIDLNRPWTSQDWQALEAQANAILREHDFPTGKEMTGLLVWRWDEELGLCWAEPQASTPLIDGASLYVEDFMQSPEAVARWPADCNLRWALNVNQFLLKRYVGLTSLQDLSAAEFRKLQRLIDATFDFGIWLASDRLTRLHGASLAEGHRGEKALAGRRKGAAQINEPRAARITDRRAKVKIVADEILDAWEKKGRTSWYMTELASEITALWKGHNEPTATVLVRDLGFLGYKAATPKGKSHTRNGRRAIKSLR